MISQPALEHLSSSQPERVDASSVGRPWQCQQYPSIFGPRESACARPKRLRHCFTPSIYMLPLASRWKSLLSRRSILYPQWARRRWLSVGVHQPPEESISTTINIFSILPCRLTHSRPKPSRLHQWSLAASRQTAAQVPSYHV